MYSPMFDSETSILGVPADLVAVGIGMALAVAGLLLWHRLLPSEPEARSLRATRGGGRLWPYGMVAVGMALIVFVAAFIVIR